MTVRKASILFTIVLLMACETSIEPKGDFRDLPILYGIMSPSLLGNVRQEILLSRTYDVDGTRPPNAPRGTPLPGATVSIMIQGQQLFLRESLYTFANAPGDTIRQTMYVYPSFRFIPGEIATVTASLPDGRTLTATTQAPPFLYFETSYNFPRGITTAVKGFVAGNAWTLSWDALPEHLYWPRLTITYQHKLNDSTTVTRYRDIPTDILLRDGAPQPLYPTYTWESRVSFTFDAIDSAMASISQGDPDKGAYKIISATFNVLAFDTHLSRYYASVHGSLDEYSIRTDPTAYTNIVGGLGVFGSQTSSTFEYHVDALYVRTFGYTGGG